ncbi:MAG TPA: tetratricopeptide repeat protein [Gammaproteobacteria bacterium]
MPVVILSAVVQGLAILHVLRTGRDMRWIFLILFLPGFGALIYFVAEVLPSLSQSLAARRAVRRVRSVVDPTRGLRAALLEYERNPSIETASRYAAELTRAGRHEEAIRVCNDARKGLFEDDPKILLALANAQHAAGLHRETIETLDRLRDRNPGFRSPDGHLLYARSLEESGDTGRALEEYAALARYYPGAEARVRHALLCKRLGRTDEATALFAAILKDARLAPKHFRRSQREWLELAKRESEG